MPDRRTQRGAHPSDRELFARDRIEQLSSAVHDLSWLLERGYSQRAATALVGTTIGLWRVSSGLADTEAGAACTFVSATLSAILALGAAGFACGGREGAVAAAGSLIVLFLVVASVLLFALLLGWILMPALG